jgi:ABC-type sugar transport system ATPase subunit
MSLLSITHLAKSYGGTVALRDGSLTVDAGEVLALMGENGAGKSTLIKILAGATPADSGEIAISGARAVIASPRDAHRLGLRFLHQELNVVPGLSVAENLFLGRAYPRRWGGLIDWRALRERSRAALATLGVDEISPDAILGRLPVGYRMIVRIAATFLEDEAPARLFVMDEPTAALSAAESERLFRIIGELQKRGAGIVYVSHRIDEVLRLADRITVLRDGASLPTMSRAEATRERLIESMTGRAGMPAAAAARVASSAKVALAVDHLVGDRLHDISFALAEGEILGVAGLVDAGGDRLLKALMGEARGGEIAIRGERVKIRSPVDAWRRGLAYVPRERRAEGLFLRHDIARNVALPHLRRLARVGAFVNPSAERREVAELGRRMRLRATGPTQKVWRLSGGNQQKVMLARAAAGAPKVLLLDEPTRGVDISAKFDIHEILRELAAGGAGVLVVSSDQEELLALCSRIAILIDGRLARIVPAAGLTPARLLTLCHGYREP